jgi:hypothetical protein
MPDRLEQLFLPFPDCMQCFVHRQLGLANETVGSIFSCTMSETEVEWVKRHDEVNKAFATDAIATEPRHRLERYLVTLAQVKMASDENQAWNNRRADVIRHLLQVRISEELHRRSWRVSIAALIVSICALVVTIWQVIKHR